MSRQLTIRGVPDEVAKGPVRVSRARGKSVNASVNEILAEAVLPQARRARLQGCVTWTEVNTREFSEALAEQRTIDAGPWR
jgi:plasmid stability protein